jgi:hypothetical protein
MKMKLAPSHQKDKAGESSQKLSNNFTELFKSKKEIKYIKEIKISMIRIV